MARSFENHEIGERATSALLAMCNIKDPTAKVPEEVEAAYWLFKLRWDRFYQGQALPPAALLMCAMRYDPLETDEEECEGDPDIRDLFKTGAVLSGDKVEVFYRNRWTEATACHLGGDPKRFVVNVAGEERKLQIKHIRTIMETASG